MFVLFSALSINKGYKLTWHVHVYAIIDLLGAIYTYITIVFQFTDDRNEVELNFMFVKNSFTL